MEGYKIFHEINKLAHERYKLQAEAQFHHQMKRNALDSFKKMNEDMNRDTVRMGIELNQHNL